MNKEDYKDSFLEPQESNEEIEELEEETEFERAKRIEDIAYFHDRALSAIIEAKVWHYVDHIDTEEGRLILDKRFHYNNAVEKFYYACYYLASALLLTKRIYTKTHSGALNRFNKYFVNTKQIDKSIARIYRRLFDERITGSYRAGVIQDKDFYYETESEVKKFIETILPLVNSFLKLNSCLE